MSTNEKEKDQAVLASPAGQTDAGGPAPERKRQLLKTATIVLGLAVVLALALGVAVRAGGGEDLEEIPTQKVHRGPLTVSVTEGGTLMAIKSLEIKSELEGRSEILEIVPEGTVITEKDVTDKKVLIKLDTADFEEKEASRDIAVRNAEANLKKAEADLAIQVKTNESNVEKAKLNRKFGRMELALYLGAKLAEQVLAKAVDFAAIGEHADLGGEARQRLRDLQSEVEISTERRVRAAETLKSTKKLYEKKYVSRDRLETDTLAGKVAEINRESAKEALRLFLRYSLPKEAEERFSDYEEAVRELSRVEAKASSELSQAEVNQESKAHNYKREKERLDKTREMIQKAVIVATKPGLVVYASTGGGRSRRSNPISEGYTPRQNETLIRMPDLSTLAARVNVHETSIKKISKGQKAWISVEAIPGSRYPASVVRISPMASSEHRWLNPDLMVYETDVALDEIPAEITPGMSATAEIIVAELVDALFVPVQAVATHRGQRICWVKGPYGPERRQIEVGHFTEKYVEIKAGLQFGEDVYLAPPVELEEEEVAEEAPGAEKAEEAAKTTPAEQTAAPAEQGPAEQAAPEAQADEKPETELEKTEEFDADAVRQQMEGMSREERREFIRNLPEEQRRKLFAGFRRRGDGRPGGGGERRPRGQGGGSGGRGERRSRGEGRSTD